METPIKTYRDLANAAMKAGKLDVPIQLMYHDLGADQYLPIRVGSEEYIFDDESASIVSI